jgi:hypothetical protein
MEKVERQLFGGSLLMMAFFMFSVLLMSAHSASWWYIAPFAACFIMSTDLALRTYLTFFRD